MQRKENKLNTIKNFQVKTNINRKFKSLSIFPKQKQTFSYVGKDNLGESLFMNAYKLTKPFQCKHGYYLSNVTPFPTNATGGSSGFPPSQSISKNFKGSEDPWATDRNAPIFLDSAQSLSLKNNINDIMMTCSKGVKKFQSIVKEPNYELDVNQIFYNIQTKV